MFISPVNFTGATKYIYSKDATKQEMTVEVKLAEDARRHGVEVPSYKGQVFPEGLALKYFIEGDPADPKTNPIMQAHLENLFSNFYKLEEIGLHHSLLNSNNVSYGKNGKVEIESMRSAQTFSTGEGYSALMPSNADSYEENGLCYYVDGIEDKYKQNGFLREYLKQKSKYHKERAELLIQKGTGATSKAVVAEDIKCEALRKPSNEIINHTRDKFEIYILRNEAAKMWHEGNIHTNGKAKTKKRFISAALTLEVLKRAVLLEENAKNMSKDALNADEREYFGLEAEQLGAIKEDALKTLKENGAKNFGDKTYGKQGLFLGTKADEEFYSETFKTIKNAVKENKPAETINMALNILGNFYRARIKDWTMENNAIYRKTYESEQDKADIIPIEGHRIKITGTGKNEGVGYIAK